VQAIQNQGDQAAAQIRVTPLPGIVRLTGEFDQHGIRLGRPGFEFKVKSSKVKGKSGETSVPSFVFNFALLTLHFEFELSLSAGPTAETIPFQSQPSQAEAVAARRETMPPE